MRSEGWTVAVVEKWISYRDAKLDELIWKLVDELLGRHELATADPKNLEKWSRQADALQAIRNLRGRYKPPVMPGVRKDLYGFGDILAFRASDYSMLVVQATSYANLNARIVKAKRIPEFDGWLAAGGQVEFHGWRKRKLKTGNVWDCKRVAYSG